MSEEDFHNMLKALSYYMMTKDESPVCAKDILILDTYISELQRKLNIAVEALEKIRQAKGGVILMDDLGHKWEQPEYEGKIAQEALKKLEVL